jgi:hypothetical protein
MDWTDEIQKLAISMLGDSCRGDPLRSPHGERSNVCKLQEEALLGTLECGAPSCK